MVTHIPDGAESEVKEPCRVVVVFENVAARELAVRQLAEVLSLESGLENWWSFALLTEDTKAREAAERAARADLVVFAFTPAGDLPAEVKLWIEMWMSQRSEREGAIVGLVDCPPAPGELACLKEIYLRRTAHRAGMDYLSQIPTALPCAMPDSQESYRQRAGQVTSLLDEILRTSLPPTLGL